MSYTDADGPSTSTGLLGICLSSSTSNDQIRPFILDGYISVDSSLVTNKSGTITDDNGKPIYLSVNPGEYDMLPPTNNGQVVRIIGQVISAGPLFYTIFFRPDNTWIEL
jgi:hypothetical protein